MQLNIRGWFTRWKKLERRKAVVRMDAWKWDYGMNTGTLYQISEWEHMQTDFSILIFEPGDGWIMVQHWIHWYKDLWFQTQDSIKQRQFFPALSPALVAIFSGTLEWGEQLGWMNYHCICKSFSLHFVLPTNPLTNSLRAKPNICPQVASLAHYYLKGSFL